MAIKEMITKEETLCLSSLPTMVFHAAGQRHGTLMCEDGILHVGQKPTQQWENF